MWCVLSPLLCNRPSFSARLLQSNPEKKPTLELHNSGSKARRITRGSESIAVGSQQSRELQDGDEVFILADASVR